MTPDLEVALIRLAMIGLLLFFVAAMANWLRDGLRRVPGRQRRPLPPLAALVVVAPGRTHLLPGQELPIAGRLTIGRLEGNSLVLPDPSVSAHHAVLDQRPNGWFIRDLGSTNGTMVEGRPVGGRWMALPERARLRFGEVVLEFRARASVAAVRLGDAEQQPDERVVHHEAGPAIAHERQRYPGGGDEP